MSDKAFEAFDKIVNKLEDEAVMHCAVGVDADTYCSAWFCNNWGACDDNCGCQGTDWYGCTLPPHNFDGNICTVSNC